MTSLVRRVGDTLLWATAILGVVSILLAVGFAVLGVKPLVFRSGSMEPTIPTGSLAFAHEVQARHIHEGDVVSVLRSDGSRVSHRVVAVVPHGDRATLTLQGDANATPDEQTYDVGSALRIFAHVPGVGGSVRAAALPLASLLALVAGGVLAVKAFRLRGAREPRPRGRRRAHRRRLRLPLPGMVAVAVTASAVLALVPTGTWALFKDTSAVTSGTLTARSVTAPASMSCTTSGSSAVLSFPNTGVNQSNYYVVELAGTATGAAASTTVINPSTTNPTTFSVHSGLLGGLLNLTTVYVRVYTAATGSPSFTWKTSAYREWQLTVGLVTGNVSCNQSIA